MTMDSDVGITPEERVEAIRNALPAAMRDRIEVTFDKRVNKPCVIRLRVVKLGRAARESGVDGTP